MITEVIIRSALFVLGAALGFAGGLTLVDHAIWQWVAAFFGAIFLGCGFATADIIIKDYWWMFFL